MHRYKSFDEPHASAIVVEFYPHERETVLNDVLARRTSAIIWRTKYCDQRSVVPKFVAILDYHVRTTYQVHVVAHKEIVDDRLSEAVADASLIVLPVLCCIRRIRPQQVVQQTVVWNIRRSLYPLDVVHVM